MVSCQSAENVTDLQASNINFKNEIIKNQERRK